MAARRHRPLIGLQPRPDATTGGWPVSILLAALAVATFSQGGFYASGSAPVAIVLAAGVLVAGRSQRYSFTELRSPVVAYLLAVGIWGLASATFAGTPTAGLPIAALVASMSVVLVLTRRIHASDRRTLVYGIVAIGALISVTGWLGAAFRAEPWARSVQGLWRAEGALTYANALGALACVGALMGAVLGARAGRTRAPLASATAVMLATLAATMSRGAIISFCVGLAVAAWLTGARAFTRALIAPALGATVAFATLIPTAPAEAPARPVLTTVGLLAGALLAAALARASNRVLAASLVVGTIGAGTVLAMFAPQVGDIVDTRFTLASTGRVGASSAAVEIWRERPLTGAGPGLVPLIWSRPDGTIVASRYVHNEYLQTLAELGLIGAALVIGLFASAGRALRRSALRKTDRGLWVASLASLVALAVHSSMDFLWHIPVFGLLAAATLGLVTSSREEPT